MTRTEVMDYLKGKAVPELTMHNTMKTYWGNQGIDPRILDIGT